MQKNPVPHGLIPMLAFRMFHVFMYRCPYLLQCNEAYHLAPFFNIGRRFLRIYISLKNMINVFVIFPRLARLQLWKVERPDLVDMEIIQYKLNKL